MTRIAIVSKGKSLLDTWPDVGPWDEVVAVNDALSLVPWADWLCMLDIDKLHDKALHLSSMFGITPRKGVMTAETYLPFAKALFPDIRHVGSDHINRIGWERMPRTILAALWFASQDLKGTDIHLFGVDLGGENIHGKEESVERGRRRWPDEQNMVRSVITAIRNNGVKITCHGLFKV